MGIDSRKALPKGTVLNFQGILCRLDEEIGRGSNALVYQGSYQDALEQGYVHRVFVKELFPLHVQGKIFRQEDGSVFVEPEGEEVFQMHRRSFEAGNRAHLALLETCPDQIGANLNTCALNGTLYTLLGVSGGESLEERQRGPARSLRSCAGRMLAILDALEIFHENNLAHLDISPDNIILLGSGKRERALLIDYNSSMTVGPDRGTDSAVFSIKQGYTAPEIRSGHGKDIGFASDMYSVTAVFYRLLTGAPLTSFQMIRAVPPDVSDCPCMKREADTVKLWVREILRRGLQTLPGRRYQSTSQMRRDLEELVDRIDGVGITHWALWEAGRRQAERMIRDNPSLSFIRDSANLFPSMVSDGTGVFPAEKYIREKQENVLLLGDGGMGKTTVLLRMVFAGDPRYAPNRSAVMYLSLYGWREGENSYILNSILDGMHFRPDTHTYEDARKALQELLDQPLMTREGSVPVLLLLLDGFNEVVGDTGPLLDEICRLASMQAVRLVTASRREETKLPFARLHLSELTDENVRDALSGTGLLMPESSDVRKLLYTPMMLSMYIRSGQMAEKQVRAESSEELLRAYFSALKEKAVRDLPDETDRRWQIETAMDLVLPALTAEIHKKQRALEDRELLPTVEKCFRLLNGHLSRRFFPQWIGRTAAIRGTAGNAEEWYGQVIHDILWKQLGLLMRDEMGRYTVSHQVIEDYLLDLNTGNRRRINRYYYVRASLLVFCVCLAAALSGHIYQEYIAPTPYEEVYAENVMTRALGAYLSAGNQYELLAELTDCAIENKEAFEAQLDLFKNAVPYHGFPSERSQQYLTDMLETGEVMPWSKKPMDEDACRELLALSESRQEEYRQFAAVLEFVMTDEYANRHYGEEYPKLLSEVLENDADIASRLYQIVCRPHVTGKYADDSATGSTYGSSFGSVPRQNDHLADEDIKQSREDLLKFEGNRNRLLAELYSCGAFEAYK